MFFELLHWVVTSVLFDVGFLYAAFIVLRPSLYGASTAASTAAEKSGIHLPISSLKLCLMLTFLASLSYVGMNNIPLFLEARVMITWLLLSVPPASHEKVYDNAFEPLFGSVGRAIIPLESNQMITRKIVVNMVRGCVELAALIMRCVAPCGVLDEDEIHDVMGGLMFVRRALHDMEAMQQRNASSSFSSS